MKNMYVPTQKQHAEYETKLSNLSLTVTPCININKKNDGFYEVNTTRIFNENFFDVLRPRICVL